MKNRKIYITVALLVISVVFILLGVVREEHLEVMSKAVRICLECIGIG